MKFGQHFGPLANLIQSKNWSASSIGGVEHWPTSLQITLGIISRAKLPMMLFWGPEHLCFYNNACLQSMGIIGKHPQSFGNPGHTIWPETWQFTLPILQEVSNTLESVLIENQVHPINRGGKVENVYWSFHYSPVTDEGNIARGVLVTSQETTKEISLQQSLRQSDEKYRTIIENALYCFLLSKADGMILDANHAAEEVFGYAPEEIKKIRIESLFQEPESVLTQHFAWAEKEGKAQGELMGIRKNGEKFPCESSSVVFYDKTGEKRTSTVIIDISERKKIEREKQLLINNTEESFILIDMNLNIVSFNKQFKDNYQRLLGKEVIAGDSIINYTQQGRKDAVREIYKRVLAGEIVEFDIQVPSNDLSILTYTNTYKPAYDENGKLFGAFVTSRDITKNKQAQAALIQSEDKYRSIVEHNFTAVLLVNTDGSIQNANNAAIGLFRYSEQEFYNLKIAQLFDGLGEETFKHRNRGELIAVRKDFTKFYCEFSSANFKDIDGNTRTSITLIDITERKAFEEKLAKKNRLYAFISAINQAIVHVSDQDTLFKEVCRIACEIGQFRMSWIGKLDAKSKAVIPLVHFGIEESYLSEVKLNALKNHTRGLGPTGVALREKRTDVCNDIENDPRMAEWKDEALKRGYRSSIALPIEELFGGGRGVFNLYSAETNFFDSEEISLLEGVVADLTFALENIEKAHQHKKAEKQIIINEKRFRALVENGADAVVILNLEGRPTYASPSVKRILGYSEQEVPNLELFSLVHLDDLPGLADAWQRVLKTKGVPVPGYTSRVLHKNGSWRWLEATLTNMIDDPTIGGIVDNFRDVTDRVMLENAREFERRDKEALINATEDLIWSVSKDFNLIAGNKSFLQALYKSTGVMLKPGDNLLLREHFDNNFIDFWQNLYEKALAGTLSRTELHMPANVRGAESWADIGFSQIFDQDKIVGIACHSRDLTKRKKREQEAKLIFDIINALQARESVEKSLMEVLKMIGLHMGFEAAEAWFLGQDKERLMLRANWVVDKSLDKFLTQEKTVFALGEGLPGMVYQNKEVVFLNDLKESPVFVRKALIEDLSLNTAIGLPIMIDNEVIAVLTFFGEKPEVHKEEMMSLGKWVSIQIAINIHRKQAEEALLMSTMRFRTVFQEAPFGIALIDSESTIIEANPKFASILGKNQKEVLHSFGSVLTLNTKDQEEMRHMALLNTQKLESFKLEKKQVRSDGSVAWIKMTVASLNTSDQESVRHICMIEDVTENKELGDLLNKANTLAKIGSWELNYLRKSVYWSEITKEIFEVKPSFSPGLVNETVFNNDAIAQLIKESLQEDRTWDVELQIITSKGNSKWVRSIGHSETVNGQCVRVYGSFQDIDSRKKVELHLQTSLKALEDYKFALDESSIIAITDKKGFILSVNDNFCKISKFDREELIGNTHQLINSGYHPKEFFTDLWKTISSGKAWKGEIKNLAKDGSYYWVYTTIVPFLDEKQKPFQYLAIRSDITEKKIAEEAALSSLQEKNTILESIGDAFFAVDNQWTVLYWNNMAEKVLHKPKHEVLGKSLWEVFSESIDSESYKNYHLAIKTNQPIHFQDYFAPLNKWYEISAYPSERGLSVYFKDITHRIEAEQKIKQSHELLLKLTDKVPAAIYQFEVAPNGEMSFPFMSKGADTVGIKRQPDEITTRPLEAFDGIHPDDLPKMMQSIEESRINLTDWEMEYRTNDATGNYKWVRGSSRPEKKPDGTVVWYGYLQDITYLKMNEKVLLELNSELKKQTTALETSNQELERFAYVASHDLQEPLRMVSSFLQLLKKKYDSQLDHQAQEYIHYAVDGSERMKQLILDLLEYSRAGTNEEKRELVDLNKILSEVINMMGQSIKDTDTQIEVGELPQVMGVPTQMIQLFQNLIGNAIKYKKPHMAPVISILAKEEKSYWLFEIADNGMGIDERFHEKIFIIFQRLHNRKEFKGTGIGLAICKKIVERHGGEIGVNSVPEKGSTFYFTLKKG